MKQKTLNHKVSFSGIGVHFGLEAKVVLRPAQVDTGILFQDPNGNQIKIGQIVPQEAMHATVLNSPGFMLSTVEHLMASIVALNIDNLVISVYGPEIPILDGSAISFVDGILSIGLQEQDRDKQFLTPKYLLEFKDKDGRCIQVIPAIFDDNKKEFDQGLYFDYLADFSHPLVGKSQLDGVLDIDYFVKNIAPARTFGFLEQLPFLRRYGLAKGTTLGNTVVLSQEEFLNERRFQDEFVRHKLLDLIGDLSLLGKKLAGTIKAQKTGHSFNRLIVKHFIENPELWQLV